jgi:hypothetical protein
MLWRIFKTLSVAAGYILIFVICAIIWLTVCTDAFHGIRWNEVWEDICEGSFNNF